MPPHEDASPDRFSAPPFDPASPPHLPPGRRIDDLVIGALIGRGGMSEVYRARVPSRSTVWAVKILDPRVYTSAGPRYREMLFARLRREGRLQQEIRHPNVVRVDRVVETAEGPALVMEWVDGPTLDVVLRHRDVLSWSDIDDIAQGLLSALARAQRSGVVHRDIKPSNVLLARVDGRWVPKLTDFGLAKLPDGQEELTLTGQVMGTPGYMPPAQMDDAKHVDPSVDTYAMGAVLYEVATGERLVPVWQRASAELVARALRRLADVTIPAGARRAIEAALAPADERPDAASVLAVWQGQVASAPRWRPALMIGLVATFTALWTWLAG